jgi:hypothetical protein
LKYDFFHDLLKDVNGYTKIQLTALYLQERRSFIKK